MGQFPTLRMGDHQVALKLRRAGGRNGLHPRLAAAGHGAIRRHERDVQKHFHGRAVYIRHCHLGMHGRQPQAHLRSGNEHFVGRNVNRGGSHQPHMPVNARARVPARGRLRGGIRAHGDYILTAPIHVAGQFIAKT